MKTEIIVNCTGPPGSRKTTFLSRMKELLDQGDFDTPYQSFTFLDRPTEHSIIVLLDE